MTYILATGINIALNKPTEQSSTFSTSSLNLCFSTYAIDGDVTNRILTYSDGEWVFKCAHTSVDLSTHNIPPWWAVDLEDVYVIESINVFGRLDTLLYRKFKC